MSRQAHLPPRCPFQKKRTSRPIHDSVFPTPRNGNESCPHHHRSSSQSSVVEEHPAWLDDLLSDPDSDSKGIFHRRSASDSVALLNGLVDPFPSLTPLNDEESSVGNETSGLESACMYGPNSPRQRSNLTFSENAIVSALSEYVSQSPMKYVDGSLSISGITCSELKGDGCGFSGEHNTEASAVKRHSGQRSRVRKLQYIAELERTVNVFQTLESELAVRVASLLQQRVALSVENSKLKQQVARLRQEKLKMDGQYQYLKKEVERLKIGLANSPNSKMRTYYGPNHATEAVISQTAWQMLEMGKLSLD
ncbi:hypothetical protein L1049_012206 [Liquidambar formosana]|uniref:Uncharacterized protein n=1 Tax=Liquidambar formosana TaxID=63359 RepID=A0AAP0RTY1_LIQFO